jgi:hypothetical protein
MLSMKIRRVFLALHRVDFRFRLDGLLSEARRLGADPYDGDCAMFVKCDHPQLRAVVGASVGLYLICRRFEDGRLRNMAVFARDPHTRYGNLHSRAVAAARGCSLHGPSTRCSVVWSSPESVKLARAAPAALQR